MKKLLIPFVCLVMGTNIANAQTLFLKPGAAAGEDAIIMTTYTCHPTGYSGPAETLNFGNNTELSYIDWTYNAGGCPHGTTRGLVRFTGLSGLPAGVNILSATLRLYGVPSSGNYGNNYYPGSPYPLTNQGWVKRITSGWNEATVTWNTQPSSTTTNQVAIPFTSSHWSWNTSLNVTSLVQDIINSGVNDGFMINLQTEAYYRQTLFASSDHADSRLWPELEVVYCDPRFVFCSSSNNPFRYDFSALASGVIYTWSVDGNVVSNNQNFTYTFPGPGSYQVCLGITSDEFEQGCERCINLCINDNEIIDDGKQGDDREAAQKTTTGNNGIEQVTKTLKSDMELFSIQSVTPNPTTRNWDIVIDAATDGVAEISLTDISGKMISNAQKQLMHGSNNMVYESQKLPAGIYLLEVKNKHFTTKYKLVKQ
jgi:hypothetical protein